MARARKLTLPPTKLPISRVRQELCPLVDDIARAPGEKIAITVGEEVAAYLVSAERLEQLEANAGESARPQRSMVGTARIVGDIGEAFRELSGEAERSFQRTVRQLEDETE
jgi:antitoxin (DNA-binding transcriptional repressor) of toxin-antitoxin stability system